MRATLTYPVMPTRLPGYARALRLLKPPVTMKKAAYPVPVRELRPVR
jgi:hypothetical protein